MPSKSSVTKFFEDNAGRLSPQSDPVAHNTNAGLLALTNYLAAELTGLHNEVSQLKRKIEFLEHQARQR